MTAAPEHDELAATIADVVARRTDLTPAERDVLADALRVRCPAPDPELLRKGRWTGCGQPAGAECRHPRTGALLHRLVCHDARVKAAGARLPPTTPAELAADPQRDHHRPRHWPD